MTLEERKMFIDGRFMWQSYINVNGFAVEPNEKGLIKLSKNLDLKKSYIRKRINIFLSN